ncbi:hypothetical protein AMTR_s00073p00132390 [Amborella trichopoda]|uniref:DUF617 domain-containing protein n=1 Tax=Amborella trichopoda TaxID=13333 RepID=W1NNN4_AMBTC|nr:hypothetical protein AMTR_s00073p00132390 [Amborella trichopoda]
MEYNQPFPPGISLLHPSEKKKSKQGKLRMRFSLVWKILPMLSTGCKTGRPPTGLLLNGQVVTGTLFGNRKGRVSLAIQEDSKSLPAFVIELPMPTHALLKEMASGLVKIALESESKGTSLSQKASRLVDDSVWCVYCNGRKTGYGVRRERFSEEELHVMRMLRGVSMGAGVLHCSFAQQSAAESEVGDAEVTYMRARFERVAGSKDSEALYMINPDGKGGPEMSIFFVRN